MLSFTSMDDQASVMSTTLWCILGKHNSSCDQDVMSKGQRKKKSESQMEIKPMTIPWWNKGYIKIKGKSYDTCKSKSPYVKLLPISDKKFSRITIPHKGTNAPLSHPPESSIGIIFFPSTSMMETRPSHSCPLPGSFEAWPFFDVDALLATCEGVILAPLQTCALYLF